MKMIRIISIIILLCSFLQIDAQILEWNGFDVYGYDVSGTPSNPWIIVQPTPAYSYQILNTAYQVVSSFSLPIPSNALGYWIIDASTDFDTDSNIEVLYFYIDSTTYKHSVFLRDISTSTNQLSFSHPDTSYYGSTFYFGDERVIIIRGYYGNEISQTYLYRSDNPLGIEILETENIKTNININTHPNPMLTTVEVSYTLPVSGMVRVTIYDASGRQLITLIDEKQESGIHYLLWNGTERKGKKLPPGNYFCEVKLNNKRIAKKIIKLR